MAPRKPFRLRRKESASRWRAAGSKWLSEALVGSGIVLGAGLGIAAIQSAVPDHWDRFVLLIGMALLVWGAVGYGLIIRLFWDGLYQLSQDDATEKR